MNTDLSIHRLAFREAETLGMAQALVVKKRQELENRLQREKVLKGEASSGAALEHALREMDEASQPADTDPPPVNDTGVLVNKTA